MRRTSGCRRRLRCSAACATWNRRSSAPAGVRRGGLTSKIHLAADRRCRPISRVTSAGQRHDSLGLRPVLAGIRIRRRGHPVDEHRDTKVAGGPSCGHSRARRGTHEFRHGDEGHDEARPFDRRDWSRPRQGAATARRLLPGSAGDDPQRDRAALGASGVHGSSAARRAHRMGRGQRDETGSDGVGRQGGQPHLRPDGDEAVLESEADLDLSRARLGARDRGDAAPHRARWHARRRDLAANAQRRFHLGLEHSPLADRVRRGAAPVRVDLLPRPRTPTSGAGAGSRRGP